MRAVLEVSAFSGCWARYLTFRSWYFGRVKRWLKSKLKINIRIARFYRPENILNSLKSVHWVLNDVSTALFAGFLPFPSLSLVFYNKNVKPKQSKWKNFNNFEICGFFLLLLSTFRHLCQVMGGVKLEECLYYCKSIKQRKKGRHRGIMRREKST